MCHHNISPEHLSAGAAPGASESGGSTSLSFWSVVLAWEWSGGSVKVERSGELCGSTGARGLGSYMLGRCVCQCNLYDDLCVYVSLYVSVYVCVRVCSQRYKTLCSGNLRVCVCVNDRMREAFAPYGTQSSGYNDCSPCRGGVCVSLRVQVIVSVVAQVLLRPVNVISIAKHYSLDLRTSQCSLA